MLPEINSPLAMGTCPETKSQPSASTARANGRCCPPVPAPPSAPYRFKLIQTPPDTGVLFILIALPRQKTPGAVSRAALTGVREHSVYPDPLYSNCRTCGMGECGSVGDSFSIEEHEIGIEALSYPSALRKAEFFCRHPAHLVYRFRQRKQFLLTAIMAQHSRKCPP